MMCFCRWGSATGRGERGRGRGGGVCGKHFDQNPRQIELKVLDEHCRLHHTH
jgi:hypothetical protein